MLPLKAAVYQTASPGPMRHLCYPQQQRTRHIPTMSTRTLSTSTLNFTIYNRSRSYTSPSDASQSETPFTRASATTRTRLLRCLRSAAKVYPQLNAWWHLPFPYAFKASVFVYKRTRLDVVLLLWKLRLYKALCEHQGRKICTRYRLMDDQDNVPRKARRTAATSADDRAQPSGSVAITDTDNTGNTTPSAQSVDLSENLMDSIPRREKQHIEKQSAPGTAGAETLDYEVPLDSPSLRWPEKTLSSTRAQELERTLAAEPWNADAWIALVEEAQRHPLTEAKAVYERALHRFPTGARLWKLYLEQLIREQAFPEAEKRFAYALPRCYSVELCQLYLHYLRTVKKAPISVLIDAFEYVTALLPYEPASASLWNDYIALLMAVPIRNAHDGAQRNRLLRSVLQRAVTLPLHNLDAFWRQFEQFESSQGKSGSSHASVATQPFHGAFLRARAEARGRRARREHLQLQALAVPPRRGAGIMEQAKRWAKYIRGEEANPHELSAAELEARLRFAHEQRLVYMYRMPDAWLEYALYLAHRDDGNLVRSYPEAIAVLERAERALPDCLLVYFTLARLYEELDVEIARIAGQQKRKREYLQEEIERLGGSRLSNDDEAVGAPDERPSDADPDQSNGDDTGSGSRESHIASARQSGSPKHGSGASLAPSTDTKTAATEAQSERDVPAASKSSGAPASTEAAATGTRADTHSEGIGSRATAVYERLLARENLDAVQRTHAYIEYMWFSRRVLGVSAARSIFRRARHDPRCADIDALPNLYLAAATLETYCNHESGVAKRIFELGLRHLPDSTEMALCYFDYLWQRNDGNELRMLIGRLLQTTLPDDAKLLLCDRWLSFEARYGSGGLQGLRLAEAERKRLFSERQPSRLNDLLFYTSFLQNVPLNDDERALIEQNTSDSKSGSLAEAPQRDAGFVPGGIIPSSALLYALGSNRPQVSSARRPDDAVIEAGQPVRKGAARAERKAPSPAVENIPEKLTLEEGLARLVGALPPALLQSAPPNPDFVIRHLLRLPASFQDLAVFNGGRELDSNAAGRRPGRDKERASRSSGDTYPSRTADASPVPFAESRLFQRLQRARQQTSRAPRPDAYGSGTDAAPASMQAPPPTRDIYRSRHRG